ncbi:MAG: 3-oxoacyl-ACP reductase family protein [Myxococcota bacterium]
MTLDGRVALVTGASRGIGRAIAIRLAKAGARVVLNFAQNEDAARSALAEVPGGALERFDVADAEAVDRAVKKIAEERGGLDILVNNAGIAIDGLLLRTKAEDWRRTIEVNLSGSFNCARAASRHLLKARERGRIVNVTSVVGEQGNAGQASYASAKAGLIGLTKALARELAPRGITVNAVSPGFIDTDMTAAHLQGEARAKLVAAIPLGRVGVADDVAEAVAYLCSPAAAYVTGQVLRVNGGLYM